MKDTVLFPLVLLAACVPLNEEQMADREYRRGEYRAKFLDFRIACEAEGGTVVIRSRRKLSPDRIPVLGDRYHCEAP